MSSITKAADDPVELAKWREESRRAAKHIKGVSHWRPRNQFAFVFNDALVKITVTSEDIRLRTEEEFADWLFNSIIERFVAG